MVQKKAQAVVQKKAQAVVQKKAQAVVQKTSRKNVKSTVWAVFFSVFLMGVMGGKITFNLTL